MCTLALLRWVRGEEKLITKRRLGNAEEKVVEIFIGKHFFIYSTLGLWMCIKSNMNRDDNVLVHALNVGNLQTFISSGRTSKATSESLVYSFCYLNSLFGC